MAEAATPAAPSELHVGVINSTGSGGTNRVIGFSWRDNANNEANYLLQFRYNGTGNWQNLDSEPAVNTPAFPYGESFYNFAIADNTTLNVRVVAQNADGYSAASPEFALPMPAASSTAFNAPSNLTVTTLSDHSLKLTWSDNSVVDRGVEVEFYNAQTGQFAYADENYFNFPNQVIFTGLPASTSYTFRVRAFRIVQQGTQLVRVYTSTYSAQATGTTGAFSAVPGNFVATAVSETSVQLAWDDQLLSESGFDFEYGFKPAQGSTTFESLGSIGSDDGPNDLIRETVGPIPDFIPGLTFDFRMRAYSNSNGTETYSGYSSVSTVTFPFHRPTNATASNVTSSSATLTWTDNSAVESGYEILARPVGASQFESWDAVPANQTSVAITGLPAGTNLEFVVRAFYEFGPPADPDYSFSDISPAAIFVTKDHFSSSPSPPATVGVALTYQLATTTISPRSSWNVTSLPPGLTFSSATGQITGTPTIAGVYTSPITATFQNGWVANGNLTFRIILPPAPPLFSNLPTQLLLQRGQQNELSLGTIFQDPEAQSAVRVTTNVGSFDMILYPSATPLSVSNFMSYVNGTSDKNYTDSIFHRAMPGFVAQAGGFKSTSAGSPYQLTSVVTSASPLNEPGISNKRGTVAMAKLGGDPNSATSQFFVNVADNSGNLDAQNGGFTVFARVAGSMAVPDAIAASPTTTRSVTINGTSTTLEDFPTTGGPTPVPIKISSVAAIPVLAFEVTGNSHPNIASASIVNNSLRVVGLAGGTSVISYRVSDLDGNIQNHQLTAVVEQTATDFLQLANLLPGKNGLVDDADLDGLTNFEEFAFMGSLTASDNATVRPKAVTVNVGGVDRQAIQFRARKFAADVRYKVEASGTLLPNSWSSVWSWQVNSQSPGAEAGSAAVNTPPRVEDMGDHYRITIVDPTLVAPGTPRFLRVRLIHVTPPPTQG